MLKLLHFLKPYKWSLTAVVILVLLQALSELYLPTLMAEIVDKGIARNDISYIWRTGWLMLAVALAGTICSIAVSFLASRNAAGLGRNLRSQVFERVEGFSLHEFDRFGTVTLITRTTNDINQVQTLAFMAQRMMIGAPLMCIGGIIMAIGRDRPLSLVFLVVVPLLAAVIAFVMSKALPLFRMMQLKLDRLNLVVRENLTGIRVIRAFNRVEWEQQRFDRASVDLMENAIQVNKLMATLMPTMMLIMNFTIIAIIWFGSVRIGSGEMQVGSLMAFIQYSMQILVSLIMMSMLFIMMPRASASAVRVSEVLETVQSMRDGDKSLPPGTSRGFLELRDVTFRYPGAEKPAVNRVSFCVRPGEITALIGGTGSGKSTIINLIMRFYDPEEGCILLNGIDIRELRQEALRSRIGFVPQKPVIFSGTIADNIRFGCEEAGDEEVRQAAEIAQAAEFIEAMKDGYNSVIEQGGTNLSGGQKQRLAIARALVRRPDVYIFDDCFSALDFKTDARLRAALRARMEGAGALIVAQRVATVMNADRIVVLDEGQVAGIGTHRDLMNTCEVYREIVYSQLSEEELA